MRVIGACFIFAYGFMFGTAFVTGTPWGECAKIGDVSFDQFLASYER